MECACIFDCTRELAVEALKATYDGKLLDEYGDPEWDGIEAMRYLEALAESNEASALVQAAANPTGS